MCVFVCASVCERKHGLSTEPFPVSACAGGSKNLKDLKVECVGSCTRDVLYPAPPLKPINQSYTYQFTVKERNWLDGGEQFAEQFWGAFRMQAQSFSLEARLKLQNGGSRLQDRRCKLQDRRFKLQEGYFKLEVGDSST